MPLFRDSSIRRKLSMLIFFTNLLGLSIAGLAFEIYERASFRAALVNRIAAHADMLGLNTAASLAFNDKQSAQDLLGALRLERNILAARIYDSDGNIFAEYRRDNAGGNLKLPAWHGEETRIAGESLTVYRNLRLDGKRTGGIAIVSDFSELQAKMTRFREISLLVLIGSFNQMLERIQERDVALNSAKEDLEVRVLARTEELQREVIERMRAEKLQRIAYDATRLLAV